MPSVVIVVPSIREHYLTDFLTAWSNEFRPHHIIVVEDNPKRSFKIQQSNLTHVSWHEIDLALGEDAWIIPRRTDCVRSFGYILAHAMQPDMILTLDDDCFPNATDFIASHWAALQTGCFEGWSSTGTGALPRGVPYLAQTRLAPAVLNHGLWTNVPDYDAITQLSNIRTLMSFEPTQQTIPYGKYFPMCGMNISWRPVLTPALYFLLMGRGYKYDRFGDIWAGILAKRIADHLGYAINSGAPTVEHRRASNVWANLVKEAPAMEANESLWQTIASTRLTSTTVSGCYQELSAALDTHDEYWQTTSRAMTTWLRHVKSADAVLAAVQSSKP